MLCTTSTLSAGVNLPAHRVIIREPKMGPQLLSVSSFRQMAGRAGRTGSSASGEAILIIRNSAADKHLAAKLCFASNDPLMSSLHRGYGGGVEKLLLDMMACGKLKTESESRQFMERTLMSCQVSRGIV